MSGIKGKSGVYKGNKGKILIAEIVINYFIIFMEKEIITKYN